MRLSFERFLALGSEIQQAVDKLRTEDADLYEHVTRVLAYRQEFRKKSSSRRVDLLLHIVAAHHLGLLSRQGMPNIVISFYVATANSEKDAIDEATEPWDTHAGKALLRRLSTALPKAKKDEDLIAILIDEERLLISRVPRAPNTAQTRDRVDSPAPRSEGSPGVFIRPLHRYHLTLDRRGKPTWVYALMDFAGRDDCEAPIVVHDDDEPDRHPFTFQSERFGRHILVKIQRKGADNDVAVELFPFPESHKGILAGVRANDTWKVKAPTVAASIVLLSESPLPGITERVTSGPVADSEAPILLRTWDEFSPGIQRLPEGSFETQCEFFAEFPEAEVRAAVSTSSRVRLMLSWFPKLASMTAAFQAAVRRKTRIEVLASHPESVFARYRGLAVHKNADAGARRILDMREQLRELANVSLKSTDLPIPTAYLEIDDIAYYSMLWADGNAVNGPWSKVPVESVMGHALAAQFDWLWSSADDEAARGFPGPPAEIDDLSGPPPPCIDHAHGTYDGFVSPAGLARLEEIAAKAASSNEILVAGNLANVGELGADYSKLIRSVVHRNAATGINYRYLYPQGQPGGYMLEELKRCFVEKDGKPTRGRLTLHVIPDTDFRRLSLVTCHFICFNPNVADADIYMQMPVNAPKGWCRLDLYDARRVMEVLTDLLKQFPGVQV